MRFTKMHGIGNDYVYVDLFDEQVPDPTQLAIEVSDRRFGVGGDGLILIGPSDIADFSMRMFNADGSESEMCGNGVRCVGKYVYDHGRTRETTVTLATLGGVKVLELFVSDGKVDKIRVDMGEPILERALVPMLGPEGTALNEVLIVDGQRLNVTAVSMGNPHCVMFVDDTATAPVTTLGPKVEVAPEFPRRTNVEFAQVISPTEISLRVWERGSGETLACGTGTCATVVAAHLCGYTDKTVRVHLLGGDLDIEWAENGHVFMTGPATEVFTGVLTPR